MYIYIYIYGYLMLYRRYMFMSSLYNFLNTFYI